MKEASAHAVRPDELLLPEKVAYWYFRLNGFLQIENFVVHPSGRGSQRTDADLVAVRFPYRAEFLLDHPHPMPDDEAVLRLSSAAIDLALVEVKGVNQLCALNGPWTIEERQNINRVLAAVGCVPHNLINEAAARVYRHGIFDRSQLRIRLISVGGAKNAELEQRFPQVAQVTWPQILGFIWHRFYTYRNQKTQVQQWDRQGLLLKRLSDSCRAPDDFISRAISRMG